MPYVRAAKLKCHKNILKKNKSLQNYIPKPTIYNPQPAERTGRVEKEVRKTEIRTEGGLWHGFERDEGKFPSWYSGVKNTGRPSSVKVCLTRPWINGTVSVGSGLRVGTRDEKMDTKTLKKKCGEKSISVSFLHVQTCCCLWPHITDYTPLTCQHCRHKRCLVYCRHEKGRKLREYCGVTSVEFVPKRTSYILQALMWVGPTKNELEVLWCLPGTIAPKKPDNRHC